ncbi:MAG: Rho-binding antiterminator [Acidobacteria bacterium]|nr:Rho-binding antiterminator [Acidobacteriota bacterium]
MAEDGYTPISCDDHDRLEDVSVRKQQVELEFDRQGVRQRERGLIADVYTAGGAEWVRLSRTGGELEIRMDELVGMREVG